LERSGEETTGTVIHTRAVVGPDGTIGIRAPELTPGQEVEVTVEVQAPPGTPEEKKHVIDIIKDLPGHLVFQTAEEVDAYIREERDSWDR
jgi:hypothetical protein